MMKKVFVVICFFILHSYADKRYSNFSVSNDLISRNVSSKLKKLLTDENNVELNIYGEEGVGKKSLVYQYIATNKSKYDITWIIRNDYDVEHLLFCLKAELAKDKNIPFQEKIGKLSRLMHSYNWLILVESDDTTNQKFAPTYNPDKLNHIIHFSSKPFSHMRQMQVFSLNTKELSDFFKRKQILDKEVQSAVYSKTAGNIKLLEQYCSIYLRDYQKDKKLFLYDMRRDVIRNPYKYVLKKLIKKDLEKTETTLFLREISSLHSTQFIDYLGLKEFWFENNIGTLKNGDLYITYPSFSEHISYYTRRKSLKKLARYISETKPFEINDKNSFGDKRSSLNYIYFLLNNCSFDHEVYKNNKNFLFELVSHLIYEERNWIFVKKLYENNKAHIFNNITNREIRRALPVFAFGFYHLENNKDEAENIFNAYNPSLEEKEVYFEYHLQRAQFLSGANKYIKYENSISSLKKNKNKISDKLHQDLFSYLCALNCYYKRQFTEAYKYIKELNILEKYASSLPLVLMKERVIEKLGKIPEIEYDILYQRYIDKFQFEGYKDFQIMIKSLIIRKYLREGNFDLAKVELILTERLIEKRKGPVDQDYLIEFKLTKAAYYKAINDKATTEVILRDILSYLNIEGIDKPHYYIECYYNLAILNKNDQKKFKEHIKNYMSYSQNHNDVGEKELVRLF